MKNLKKLEGLRKLTRNDQKSIVGGKLQEIKCKLDSECTYGCYSYQGCGELCSVCNPAPININNI